MTPEISKRIMSTLRRRDFVKGLFALPAFAIMSRAGAPLLGAERAGRRALVVVHLAGGNDGLNTVVPVADPLYRKLRPALAVPTAEALAVDRGLAFHPALAGFKSLYERGELAVALGVGYPRPDFSHFRATEIWYTASPDGGSQGWLGRFLDETRGRRGLRAVALSKEQPPLALASSAVPGVTIADPADFAAPPGADRLRRMYEAYAKLPGGRGIVGGAGVETFDAAAKISGMREGGGVRYPNGELAADLRRAAALLGSGLGVEVIHISFGGFDTHVNQNGRHRQLLRQVGDAFAAFQQDLMRRGVSKQVATFVFSEFGRRPAENFGGGTDHGSAGPAFVIAEGVRGGFHGEHPSLSELENGNLVHTTDFRSVYAALLRDCLGADPRPVVGDFEPIALF
jgi:uncharacterized protein (DUF1501 family)